MCNKINCVIVFLYSIIVATVLIFRYLHLQKIEKENIELFGKICYNRGYLDARKGLEAKSEQKVKEIINKTTGR